MARCGSSVDAPELHDDAVKDDQGARNVDRAWRWSFTPGLCRDGRMLTGARRWCRQGAARSKAAAGALTRRVRGGNPLRRRPGPGALPHRRVRGLQRPVVIHRQRRVVGEALRLRDLRRLRARSQPGVATW